MQSPDLSNQWPSLLASAADLCIKPWIHSVVLVESELIHSKDKEFPLDIAVLIQARRKTGERVPEQDIELEVFKSSNEINIILSWHSKKNSPILWHGKHPVWMDGDSGIKVEAPQDSSILESFARKVRALFVE